MIAPARSTRRWLVRLAVSLLLTSTLGGCDDASPAQSAMDATDQTATDTTSGDADTTLADATTSDTSPSDAGDQSAPDVPEDAEVDGASDATSDQSLDTSADATDASDTTEPDMTGPQPTIDMRVVSSRPDMVSGGDALLEVDLADATGAIFTLNGQPADLSLHPFGGKQLLYITELALGATTLRIEIGDDFGELELTNYPLEGPIFSGPHQEPFYCTTETFFLGMPINEDCMATAPLTAFWYQRTDGEMVILPDGTTRPTDAQKVNRNGEMVDVILRIDFGTINRAIYWMTVLHDPDQASFTPWDTARLWNEKVVYSFRGGCGSGNWQGNPAYSEATNPGLPRLGYAVIHSTLNTLGQNCNDVLSAETAMMVKEKFIETYGEPIYTIGLGGSGGSIQQHLIADNYPGILDGLLPQISYPDIFSILSGILDCRLLNRTFDASSTWSDPEQRRAVAGFANELTCRAWDGIFGNLIVPAASCPASIPAEAIYHPTMNPTGVRCTHHDHNVNLLGVDAATGFANRPFDNVGVQYGLQALLDGQISAAQFIDLNRNIGGYGPDGELVNGRTSAPSAGIQASYAGGRVLDGGNGLNEVPIIDLRQHLDASGDIHDSFRTHSTRERLIQRNGDADNHVAFIGETGTDYFLGLIAAVVLMDEWLLAMEADPDPDRAAVVRRHRPAGLTDRCYRGESSFTEGLCPQALPNASSPRRVAGAPIENNTLQCALKPIDAADYNGLLNATQLDLLQEAFPSGVCDWSAAPANQVPHAGTWQRYDQP